MDCYKLDPSWDKAQARVATAQEYLGKPRSSSIIHSEVYFYLAFLHAARHQAAFASYQKAASLASDPKQKTEYTKSASRMKTKFTAGARDRLSSAQRFTSQSYEDPYVRLRRLEAQGHKYGPDSAARRHALVSTEIRKSWIVSDLRISN